jgi:Family of unknown function (DUF6152)
MQYSIASGFSRGAFESRRKKSTDADERYVMKFKYIAFVCLAGTCLAMPVQAHHSFAMFDSERTKTLAGTVKEFQWTNPHAWIILQVAGINGDQAQWAVELNGAYGLARQGWRPKTLSPGMPITVTIHPLKDGTAAGELLTVTLPDGTQIGPGQTAARQTE